MQLYSDLFSSARREREDAAFVDQLVSQLAVGSSLVPSRSLHILQKESTHSQPYSKSTSKTLDLGLLVEAYDGVDCGPRSQT